jgi:arylformamidase
MTSDIAKGDDATVSILEMGAHTGTHIDAPSHFVHDGGGIETIPLDALAGAAIVADFTHIEKVIGADDLDELPRDIDRLIVKTRNSGWSKTDTEFRSDYVAFDESAAEWCVEYGLQLLGIDYLSIEPFGSNELEYPTHNTLLEDGIVVLEGLDLDGIEPGPYFLVALPLLIPGGDGAPARVLLFDTARADT